MTTHIVNEAVISFKLAQMNTSYLECQTSASHATPFIFVSFTAGELNLPAVLAGAVVAFLLLILLIAGIIVGAVLLGRVNRKGISIGKREGLVERIECANKHAQSLENASTSGNDTEQQIVEAAFHYEQHADMHYESADVTGQRCGREIDNGMWSDGGHYDYALTGQHCGRGKDNGMWSDGGHYDYAEGDVLKEGAGHKKKTSTVQEYQPKGTADAVYAVVDVSKKKKHKKTQDGASATTTQGADTEEQHYECSSGFGQDWFGNALRVRGDVGRRSPSNDAKQAGPQSEPHNSGAVYAVVDKSKKGNKGKKNSDPV